MCYLTRINHQRNQQRFYVIDVGPSFLGDYCLIRIHGRGPSGRGCWQRALPPVPYPTEAAAIHAADKLLRKRLRRGYRIQW